MKIIADLRVFEANQRRLYEAKVIDENGEQIIHKLPSYIANMNSLKIKSNTASAVKHDSIISSEANKSSISTLPACRICRALILKPCTATCAP